MNKTPKNPEKSVYTLIHSRRSIRRFTQQPIPLELLKNFVNTARLAPSAANLQPLQYIVINNKDLCAKIFETLAWAAYIIPPWIPDQQERPTAYIIVLVTDTKNQFYQRDVGLATENILLAAEEENLGSCILCKINKKKIQEIFQIPDSIEIDSVIALGHKGEYPVVEELKNTVKYWRDDRGVLHVPKRKLEDIIFVNVYTGKKM